MTEHRDLPASALVSGQLLGGGELAASDTERLVVLAERADPRWHLTVAGSEMASTDLDWRQAFVVPAGLEGEVRLTFHDPARTAWVVAQIVVVGVVALLAVPMRRRDVEEDS